MADNTSIEKQDPTKDESGEESVGSAADETPTVGASASACASASTAGGSGAGAAGDNPRDVLPRRKGGRKPIYATSEERKQRNRQAQAAFRERRTEYIKQLEESIRVHEQNHANLQAAHRQAADEVLILRYKNSLLERILLEKGINVQAELHLKTGSPGLGPTHVPKNIVQPPQIQRGLVNRHGRRSTTSSVAPKLEPAPLTPLPPPVSSVGSPTNRPTPPSLVTSPTAASFGSQNAASPEGADQVVNAPLRAGMAHPHSLMKVAPNPHHQQQMGAMSTMAAAQRPLAIAGMNHPRQGSVSSTSYYPTPSFQSHIEQLEQEYDAQNIMDEEADTPNGPGPYPGQHAGFAADASAMQLSSPITAGPHSAGALQHQQQQHQQQMQAAQQAGGYPSMTQLLDSSNFEFDPFGLSASMAFPTQFSFDTSNMR